MFKFSREKILPVFLQKQMPISQLAKKAGVHQKTATNAVQGLPVSSKVVDKIAMALGIDSIKFLEKPQPAAIV